MNGLGSALNSALRALEANQLGLAVASNNISNAQTEGFSRQRVITRPGASFGGTFPVGSGVEVVGTEAIRDRLIDRRLRQESSDLAEQTVKYQTLSDVEILFTESETSGLMPLISGFLNSFQALSTEPTSINRRQIVTTNATKLVNAFNSAGNNLRDIQTRMDRSLREDVALANTLIEDIAKVSSQIAEQEVTQPANELRDQRSILVRQLSEIVEVQEFESKDTYQVTTAGNLPLVYNGTARPLTAGTAPDGSTTILLGVEDITSEISGGQMGAHIELRDTTVPKYITALDQLAFEVAQKVNAVHSTAYDLQSVTGTNFFTPLASADDAARNLAVNAAIAADPKKLAVSRSSSGTDNEAAIELGNLLHMPVFTGGSVTEQYRGFVFAVGSDTASAELGVRQHEALVHQLENRRQQVSGVSIDEETVKILQFQRAFEASARVIRAVDELLQLTLTLGQ